MVGKTRLSRSGARACTWTGRGCVLVAAAGASMIMFGGGPASDHTPNLQPITIAEKSETRQVNHTGLEEFDEFDMIWIQLAVWDGPSPDKDGPGETVTTPPATNTELTYLGVIKMGQRQRALMSVGGQQRFMKEGQSIGQMTLLSIAQDHVMIREDRANRRIDLLTASLDRLGYLGSNGAPVRLSSPDSFDDGLSNLDPSETRRREIANRIEQRGFDDNGPPSGVARAKARNAARSREAARSRGASRSPDAAEAPSQPGVSSDGQEGS